MSVMKLSLVSTVCGSFFFEHLGAMPNRRGGKGGESEGRMRHTRRTHAATRKAVTTHGRTRKISTDDDIGLATL